MKLTLAKSKKIKNRDLRGIITITVMATMIYLPIHIYRNYLVISLNDISEDLIQTIMMVGGLLVCLLSFMPLVPEIKNLSDQPEKNED